jgi:aquaglyceroporin related protein
LINMNKEEHIASTPSSTNSDGNAHALHIEKHVLNGENHNRDTSVPGAPAHAEHGALIDHIESAVEAYPDLWWSKVRHTCRDGFAEFMGVFILILFGDGVVAQVVLSNGTKGDYQSISWGWG